MDDEQQAAYSGAETTGFQSPAQDYIEELIDLGRILDLRKPGIYPVCVKGHLTCFPVQQRGSGAAPWAWPILSRGLASFVSALIGRFQVLTKRRVQRALLCPCGADKILAHGLCATCYTLRRQDEEYFGGL